MMILASDFDGTLNQGGVSETDREAIRRFREAGHRFGLVSGRDWTFPDYLREIGIEVDFILVCSGAIGLDGQGNVLYEFRGPCGDAVSGVVSLFGDRYDQPVGVCVGCRRFDFHSRYPGGNREKGYLPLSRLTDFPEFTVLYARTNKQSEGGVATADVQRLYGEYITPLHNSVFIDMPPRGMDKATGLLRYAELAGVPEEKIWTVGDNLNDLSMVKRFHGCAVSSGNELLRSEAQHVVDHVSDVIALMEEDERR